MCLRMLVLLVLCGHGQVFGSSNAVEKKGMIRTIVEGRDCSGLITSGEHEATLYAGLQEKSRYKGTPLYGKSFDLSVLDAGTEVITILAGFMIDPYGKITPRFRVDEPEIGKVLRQDDEPGLIAVRYTAYAPDGTPFEIWFTSLLKDFPDRVTIFGTVRNMRDDCIISYLGTMEGEVEDFREEMYWRD